MHGVRFHPGWDARLYGPNGCAWCEAFCFWYGVRVDSLLWPSAGDACEICDVEFARLLCSNVPRELGVLWHALPGQVTRCLRPDRGPKWIQQQSRRKKCAPTPRKARK